MVKYLASFAVFIIVSLGIYFIIFPALGSEQHNLPPGPIFDIEKESSVGHILILSGNEMIYDIRTSDWFIAAEIETPNYSLVDMVPSIPDDGLIYGLGWGSNSKVILSIDHETSIITSTGLPENIQLQKLVQDNDKLYVIGGQGDSLSDPELSFIIVVNKTDLSIEEIWEAKASRALSSLPDNPILDLITGSVLIEDFYPHPEKTGSGSPWDYGVQWFSRITRYDIGRGGYLIDLNKVEGHARGLALMSDGAIIVGLQGNRINYERAATLAIIHNGISYVTIGDYQVISLDYDTSSNRVFASLYDYEQKESSSNILVWDYDTSEYELVDAGVQGLSVLKYMDGKLYAATGEDDKVYVIDID